MFELYYIAETRYIVQHTSSTHIRPLFHLQAAEEVIHFWCEELTTEDWCLGERAGIPWEFVWGYSSSICMYMYIYIYMCIYL